MTKPPRSVVTRERQSVKAMHDIFQGDDLDRSPLNGSAFEGKHVTAVTTYVLLGMCHICQFTRKHVQSVGKTADVLPMTLQQGISLSYVTKVNEKSAPLHEYQTYVNYKLESFYSVYQASLYAVKPTSARQQPLHAS